MLVAPPASRLQAPPASRLHNPPHPRAGGARRTRARALLSSESLAFAETVLLTRDPVLSTAGQSREGAANAAADLLQSLKWCFKTLSAPLATSLPPAPLKRGAPFPLSRKDQWTDASKGSMDR